MNATANKIVSAAMELPGPIRAFVAKQLIESLDADDSVEISPEWKKEIEKRCKEIDQGAVDLIPGEEVFRNAYARLS
jgi:putative addiction module component (TIGR02574 family)